MLTFVIRLLERPNKECDLNLRREDKSDNKQILSHDELLLERKNDAPPLQKRQNTRTLSIGTGMCSIQSVCVCEYERQDGLV